MASISSGSITITIQPGEQYRFIATGEAYVDIGGGSTESYRLTGATSEKLLGGFIVATPVTVRVVSGSVEYRSEPYIAGNAGVGNGNIYDENANKIYFTRVINPQKIERMFARLAQSSYRRCVIGYHGMSIVSGVGANDSVGTAYGENFRTKSMAAVIGKTLTQQFGGTWAPGVDIFISGFQSVTGSASFSTAYGSVGPNGRAVQIAGGSVTYPITGGRAGQVVKIYMLAIPSGAQTDPVTARYSLSGANTLATTDMTASTGSPLAPLTTAHFYEFSFTLTNAGNTTLTILPPATGGAVQPYFVDADYRTDAGVTVHRLAYTGTGLSECCAWSLDDTDTQPAGVWTTTGTLAQRQQRRATQFDSMVNRLAATNGGASVPLDAAICSFDVNDIVKATTYGYSLADQKRHAQNYITAMNNAGVPVLFVCGNMRNPADVTVTDRTQLDIINMYKEVSDASNNIVGAAFLDLTSTIYGNTATDKYNAQWRDSLFQIASESPSYLHPASFGHARLGITVANSIISATKNI